MSSTVKKVQVLTDTIDPNTKKNREYEGQIGYISPVAEFTPKTVQTTDLRTDLVYRIRVYVDNIDEYLRQGMPVTVKINLITKMQTVIIKNLNKSFGNIQAIKDLSLNIEKGKITGLIGADGSGKNYINKTYFWLVNSK